MRSGNRTPSKPRRSVSPASSPTTAKGDATGEAFIDQGLVFCRADGSPVDPAWLTRTVKRVSKELGLPETTPHPIRHSYATAALMSREVDVKVLADRLGHSSTAITQDLYQGYLPAADERAANAIAKVILGT